MEDEKVNSVFQKLLKNLSTLSQSEANGDRLDNDGMEGDADFNPYHDDNEWFE